MTRFNALLVVGVAALVLSSSVQASVVDNLVDVFLDGLRSDQKSDPVGVNTDARVHDALGKLPIMPFLLLRRTQPCFAEQSR